MKIICLANSYKHNGRCIAGIDEAGRWVRPVSSSQKRAIDKDTRIIDGNEPQILDVLEVPLHAHGPVDGCQPENKLLKEGQWKRIGRVKPEDLLKYREADSVILHNNRDHVPANCFRMIPSYGWKSLQLVHNENVVFEQDENNKAKWRALIFGAHIWHTFFILAPRNIRNVPSILFFTASAPMSLERTNCACIYSANLKSSHFSYLSRH